MLETTWPGKVLLYRQALARARRFQIETAIVSGPDGSKRVLKRALYPEGSAHLHRMAANHQIMRLDQDPVCACPCAMKGDMLEMAFVDGISIKQQLIQAIRRDDQPGIETLLDHYRQLVTAFAPLAADLRGPGSQSEIFAGSAPATDAVVKCGNLDQGFDHLIQQGEHWFLVDYEWVLGFPVPLKYVLYRAAQLFFQDVPPPISPRFRLRDMCALYDIGAAERAIYDRMEAHFQRFVRTETGTP